MYFMYTGNTFPVLTYLGVVVYKQSDSHEFIQSVVSPALIVLMDATAQFGKIAKFPDGHFGSLFEAMNQKWGSVLDKRVEP